MFDIEYPKPAEKVILTSFYLSREDKELFHEDLAEMVMLCRTAGAEVIETVIQNGSKVKAATYTPKAKADFATNNHAIAENLNRVSLILKAAPANTGEIWIGTGADNGVPLFAGESIELNTTAAINLYAANTADNCYLSEIIK